MTYIKAPYNFVPLNKEVVKPYWTQHISHDIPFEDAQSGCIEVVMTAHSPIFVKNGMRKTEEDKYYEMNNEKREFQNKPFSFNQFNNKYFIPGSSIKGMLRAVLEVMSFGRMENKVNDHKYALRDFSSAMKDEYLKKFTPDEIFAGWLSKNLNDNTYTIVDCGHPGRISHRQLDEDLNTDFVNHFKQNGKFEDLCTKDKKRSDYYKSAQYKYDLFGKEILSNFAFIKSVIQDTSGRKRYQIFNHEIVSKSKSDLGKGTIVFTGQPGVREEKYSEKKGMYVGSGHHLEFVFFNRNISLDVPEKVMENFFFAYFEHDKTRWSEDYKIRRNELNNGDKIPVFFQKNEYGEIKHLGLSYMYKVPFEHSVKEAIQLHQKDTDYDMAETIFGFTNSENKEFLKGRVHIGHAFAINSPEIDKEKLEVLSGPKASYYPNYIRQSIRGGKVKGYNSFMDNKPEIAGWKRYPIHSDGVKRNPAPLINGKPNKKILTQFTSLKKDAQFKLKIRYHNLKKIELGALLSALTFHQTPDTFHSIGMAKPLGYGKVKLDVSGVENMQECLCAFESYMNIKLGNDVPKWGVSDQMQDLIAMVSEQQNTGKSELKYMDLKEFVSAKNNNEGLDRYSTLVNSAKMITPICTVEQIAATKEACAKEEAALKKRLDIREVVKNNIQEKKEQLQVLFDERKRWLLKALEEKQESVRLLEEADKAAVEAQARAERKAKAEEKAKAGLELYLQDFDAANRNAFDELKKIIERLYLKDLYKGLDYSKILAENSNGVLPASDLEIFTITIINIVGNIKGKKDLEKWLNPKSNKYYLGKLIDWIGQEEAERLIDQLKNNLS